MQYKDIESFPDLSKKFLVIALNKPQTFFFRNLKKKT